MGSLSQKRKSRTTSRDDVSKTSIRSSLTRRLGSSSLGYAVCLNSVRKPRILRWSNTHGIQVLRVATTINTVTMFCPFSEHVNPRLASKAFHIHMESSLAKSLPYIEQRPQFSPVSFPPFPNGLLRAPRGLVLATK